MIKKATPPRQTIQRNWCIDELIDFEEPFSGLKELSVNPVSYSQGPKLKKILYEIFSKM